MGAALKGKIHPTSAHDLAEWVVAAATRRDGHTVSVQSMAPNTVVLIRAGAGKVEFFVHYMTDYSTVYVGLGGVLDTMRREKSGRHSTYFMNGSESEPQTLFISGVPKLDAAKAPEMATPHSKFILHNFRNIPALITAVEVLITHVLPNTPVCVTDHLTTAPKTGIFMIKSDGNTYGDVDRQLVEVPV